jgi:ketosteroid isomerase-like protein
LHEICAVDSVAVATDALPADLRGFVSNEPAEKREALVEIEKTWAQALEQHDANALGCILADEFEDAGIDGSVSNRAAALARTTNSGKLHHELSDLHAHVHGDFGYIRGLATGTPVGGGTSTTVRFTDIYVYRDGRWQCVAGQESLVRR